MILLIKELLRPKTQIVGDVRKSDDSVIKVAREGIAGDSGSKGGVAEEMVEAFNKELQSQFNT